MRISSPKRRLGVLVAVGALSWQATAAAQENFVVEEGYLSTSVRQLVDSWGWSLVWRADEDRVIDHAFDIDNDSLKGALENLLGMYSGEFVADLFERNRVVLVGVPAAQTDVVMPGEAIETAEPDEADEGTAAEVAPSADDEQTVDIAATPADVPTTTVATTDASS